jgi:acetoin utilization deacetylase AcuC-like enzyme
LRKSAEIAERIPEMLVDPACMVEEATKQILNAHSREYVKALQTGDPGYLSETNGFNWDEGVWEMAVNSTAGVLAACKTVLSATSDGPRIAGSLSSGLHHARTGSGSGYCTVNGLAVAANYLKNSEITILDFDAHCGGGTVNMLRDLGIDHRVSQYDLSTNMFDEYDEDENHMISVAKDDEEYLRKVDGILSDLDPGVDLVLYNAGTDPYPTISHEIIKERDQKVFQTCVEKGIACVFVLAGGYTFSQDMNSLVKSHLATINLSNKYFCNTVSIS